MKVILLDNVKNTGKKGQIVVVADGLARNKLIPLGKAAEATQSNIAKYKHLTTDTAHSSSNTSLESHIADVLNNATLSISAKSDAHGSLYQSIHVSDIVQMLREHLSKELLQYITEKSITIPAPIKKLGKHKITLFGNCNLEISVSSNS